MRVRGLFVLLFWAAIAATTIGQAGTAQEALEAARKVAVLDGDCASAIKEYQTIVARFEKTDRATVAKALLLMAECYERLGNQEAQKIYTQLTSKYADQRDVAAQARARMTPPGQAGPFSTEPFARAPIDTRLGPQSVPSPDGTQALEFADGGLIVRGLGSGAVRTLVKRDPETSVVRTAVWSPDGRRVAFMVSLPATESRRISADINVVTLATGEVRTVTNQLLGGGMPGSPGRIPAFPITYLLRAWTIKDEILFTGSGRPDYSELFIVPAAGGESKALLKIPFPFIDMGGNQGRERIGNVTPDGAALVAVVSERLSLIDLSFGTPRVISERAGIASPQISPDGKLLAFLQRADSTWSVQVAPLGRLPIDHSVRVASLVHRAASVPEGQLRWTASETLTFAYTDNETDLYRLNVDPKTARSSGAPVRLNRDLDARTPEISPDGRQILFLTSSTRANPDNHIYIVGADGSNERRLIERANSGSVGIPPTTFGWLSNDEIVFSKPDTPELWSRNLRTGAQAAVANSASVGQQDTSGFQVLHEPARIVFARQEANPSVRTLMVHGLSDGHDQELVTMPARAQLSWSVTADLRKLAYWSLVPPLGRPEGQELHVVATDGSANKMLRAASGSGGSPVGGASWSPDGRHLLAGGRMWDSETGESWPLLDERTIASAGDWKWSPTGSYVVFKTQTTETRRLGWQRITIDAVSKLGGAKRGSVESVR